MKRTLRINTVLVAAVTPFRTWTFVLKEIRWNRTFHTRRNVIQDLARKPNPFVFAHQSEERNVCWDRFMQKSATSEAIDSGTSWNLEPKRKSAGFRSAHSDLESR
ncbi:hypothetical protein AVEN_178596-1 [Araneus ventricosus]|uniref:Uncharacterized protein n=1 Tax=Araneus ventricosus TaxID=182803 RepID=A0A4Y2WMQ4_ARAVE|nr:hypothetical protein AVEN_178596-1 [Araneus ventricosus]